jgi:cytochrome c-type biogenesis protein CcmH/NrfG
VAFGLTDYDQLTRMKRESIVFLISGTAFGLLIGWMIGTQQTGPAPAAPVTAAGPAQPATPAPPPLDTQRVAELEQAASANPSSAAPRVELGNLYFNAERFDQAVPWYEAALKLNPKDVNASTDLGVCYYYTQQDDRALAQFEHSLSMDPNHVKTLFNQGIVRAFGKQDLDGATKSWQRVLDVAPDSEEGRRVKQILDSLKTGHSGAVAPDSPPSGRGGQ